MMEYELKKTVEIDIETLADELSFTFIKQAIAATCENVTKEDAEEVYFSHSKEIRKAIAKCWLAEEE